MYNHNALPQVDQAKQPPTARTQLFWATAIVWTVNCIILSGRSVFELGDAWTSVLPARLVLTAWGLMLCFLIHLLLSRAGKSFSRQLLLALIALPLAVEAYFWANTLAIWVTWGIPPQPFDGGAVMEHGFVLWLFATWTGLYLAISYSERWRLEERRAQESRLLAQTAQLQALRYQVNPHFLFNTLNAISALIADDRKEDAERMLERLSRFLRATLNFEAEDEVTLSQELALQLAYLEVEQVRFPDLELDLKIADGTREALVPNLILQPIVENAVKHGVATRIGRSAIHIRSDNELDHIRVVIANDTDHRGGDDRLDGIGLANVRGRLAARYGASASLITRRPSERTFEVAISIPRKVAT